MDHSLIQRGLGTVPPGRMAKGGAKQYAKKKMKTKSEKKKKSHILLILNLPQKDPLVQEKASCPRG